MTVTHKQASGWWPSLITLTCDQCGLSWTIDLNATTLSASTFIAQRKARHEEGCGQ